MGARQGLLPGIALLLAGGFQYRIIYRLVGQEVLVEVVDLTAHDYRRKRLSELTGIPQSTISAIENSRINLGVERAKVLARALRVHPAVLVFPGWDIDRETAA